MKKARISFECFEALQRLKKNFIVAFVSTWSVKTRPYALNTISYDALVLEVLVDASSSAEDYCINNLLSKSLPIACVFVLGKLWKSYELEDLYSLPMNISVFGPMFTDAHLLAFDMDKSINLMDALLPSSESEDPIVIFVSGDRSSVGKTTTCLALLASLINKGVDPSVLAYIKPVTQCEATQPVVTYCERVGIDHKGIGPVVFYKGFTRAYLAGETDSSEQLIESAVQAVRAIGRGKQFVLVDGVGYPAVGSICNISNADVARALQVPVLLVGKEGVGDAVDSFNLNAAFFEIKGVTVLGGIFNKLPLTGFYSLEACQTAVSSYFRQFKPAQLPYGFIPVISSTNEQQSPQQEDGAMDVVKSFEDQLSESFLRYVDVPRLLFDIWKFNKISKNLVTLASEPAEYQSVPMSRQLHTIPPPLPSSSGSIMATLSGFTASDVPIPTRTPLKFTGTGVKTSAPTTAVSNYGNGSKSVDTSTSAATVAAAVSKASGLKRTRDDVERDAASQGAEGG